jgi:hypothetical protein
VSITPESIHIRGITALTIPLARTKAVANKRQENHAQQNEKAEEEQTK